MCGRDRTNISDALENHEENKNKDLSSTSCEFVSLECTPQVRYICGAETRILRISTGYYTTSEGIGKYERRRGKRRHEAQL